MLRQPHVSYRALRVQPSLVTDVQSGWQRQASIGLTTVARLRTYTQTMSGKLQIGATYPVEVETALIL